MCGLSPQVISDLSEEGQRSKVRDGYSHSGAPPAGDHARLHCNWMVWLARPTTKHEWPVMSGVGGIILLNIPLCDTACDRGPPYCTDRMHVGH